MDRTVNDGTRKSNFIARAFIWHYSNTKCTIKPHQFEAEKYLISKVKFNPWFLMPAAIIVQFCCGSLYAWSVFNAPIDKAISGNAKVSQAPVTFYIAVGMLGIASSVMGPYLERHGPKKTLVLSSSLFFVGNLLSALAIYLKYIWLLYIGYGVIGGFAIGLSMCNFLRKDLCFTSIIIIGKLFYIKVTLHLFQHCKNGFHINEELQVGSQYVDLVLVR